LVEIATFPELRVLEQMRANALHVVLAKGELPEMLVVVLRPKGRYRIPKQARWASPLGSSQLSLRWNVIEMWNQPEEHLLAANDLGLIPWVPLAQFAESPATMLDSCRKRIDDQTTGDARANLLAVTRVIAGLRFSEPWLLNILGGSRIMIESPVLREIGGERV